MMNADPPQADVEGISEVQSLEDEVWALAVLRPHFLHPHDAKHPSEACLAQCSGKTQSKAQLMFGFWWLLELVAYHWCFYVLTFYEVTSCDMGICEYSTHLYTLPLVTCTGTGHHDWYLKIAGKPITKPFRCFPQVLSHLRQASPKLRTVIVLCILKSMYKAFKGIELGVSWQCWQSK